MAEKYKILYQGGEDEIIEKKSRFIATTRPVKTEEEAAAFIEEMRKKYWDARHHCSAYVLGPKGQTARCSDDGEPAQTAGRPMLDVLLGSEVRDACIVVTRYFGGTLLGTGGLVRAYSQAAAKGLEASVVLEKIPGCRIRIESDYTDFGRIQYLAAQSGIPVLDTTYTDQVTLVLLVPACRSDFLQKQITEKTSARARVMPVGEVTYAIWKDEIILF
ncbi:MAG: YigZ family protein [Clostridiales bacterium]|nr:YigZ family protein [Clostridiales bacterium]